MNIQDIETAKRLQYWLEKYKSFQKLVDHKEDVSLRVGHTKSRGSSFSSDFEVWTDEANIDSDEELRRILVEYCNRKIQGFEEQIARL